MMPTSSAGFDIFAVTADKGIRAWGPEPAAVYRQAAHGLWSLMVEPASVERRREIPVAVEADDRESLLVAWLNELLYLHETERFAAADCRIVSLSETRLDAEVCGEALDMARHVIVGHVKAVTYHQLSVGQTALGWEARVVVDV